jgi:peroxiredoxin
MTLKPAFRWALLMAAIGVLGIAGMRTQSGGGGMLADRKPAPAFTLPIAEGGTFSLADQKGKGPVLVNFFATWWGACGAEFPHLQELYEKYKDRGLQVVSISMEEPELLQAYARQKGATFPLLTDDKRRANYEYQVTQIPTNILLDTEGRIVSRMEGFSKAELEAQIETLLNKSS